MGSRRHTLNFFRFIPSDDIKHTGLRIPKKFMREHRKNILLSEVLLIVSDETAWPMNMTISDDGKVWLKKGWREFAEHYCLGFGHLLVFNYRGKSVFQVMIFDSSNFEINYTKPRKIPNSKKRIHQCMRCSEDNQIKASVKTEDDFEETAVEINYSKPRKIPKSKKRIDDQYMRCSEDNQSKASVKTEDDLEEMAVKIDLEMAKEKKQGTRNRALELAKAFKSDNPFVIVTIRPSYLISSGLYLPLQFVRRYLTKDEMCIPCVLQLADGGKWREAKCSAYGGYGKLHGGGWKRFRDDNRLAVDDVCVFELIIINHTQNVLKVAIFRALQNASK